VGHRHTTLEAGAAPKKLQEIESLGSPGDWRGAARPPGLGRRGSRGRAGAGRTRSRPWAPRLKRPGAPRPTPAPRGLHLPVRGQPECRRAHGPSTGPVRVAPRAAGRARQARSGSHGVTARV